MGRHPRGRMTGMFEGIRVIEVATWTFVPAAGAVLGKIIILALIILFIQRRPQGIFALKGRAAEAM